MNKFVALIFMSLTVCLANVSAQIGGCGIEAWVIDEAPQGVEIRTAPNSKSKLAGRIPSAQNDGEQPAVEIIGYANGWVKIRKAFTVEDDVIFEGIGWVSAKMVTANVQRRDGNLRKKVELYARPDQTSRKVGSIPAETMIRIVGFDCFGLKINYKGKTGWLAAENICGNPVTTCF